MEKSYIAIDLKSFYASVECIQRKLDPLNVNLVVADKSRTNKTICLAVSPALKSFDIPGRPRLFEVEQRVKAINNTRKKYILGYRIKKYSCNRNEIINNKAIGLDYIVARPRMKLYERISAKIYGIYLDYVAPEDIHMYSIDEAFIDATPYLKLYHCSAEELGERIILDVFRKTGITATVGVGTNLYLAKVAMDILAKHMTPTKNGIKIASLNEISYRDQLWDHEPITDFWRIGKGYARRLNDMDIHTMGEVAACSLGTLDCPYNKQKLYKEFGINAEILIDHAWGFENLTIKDINQYQPKNHCLCVGQLLMEPYNYYDSLTIITEMSEELALRLTSLNLTTDLIGLSIHYDAKTLNYIDEITETEVDRFGRVRPKSVKGRIKLTYPTNIISSIRKNLLKLFNEIVDSDYLIRRITITAIHVKNAKSKHTYSEQGSLFAGFSKEDTYKLTKQSNLQTTMMNIKSKYGKNALIKGIDLKDKAMTIRRNKQIGGHLS